MRSFLDSLTDGPKQLVIDDHADDIKKDDNVPVTTQGNNSNGDCSDTKACLHDKLTMEQRFSQNHHNFVFVVETRENQTAQQPSNDEDDQTKEQAVIFKDDFTLWCMKMSVFFPKKFFPAAEKYELLNKIAHENV